MRSLDKAPARVIGTILSGALPHPPISLSSFGSDLSSHLNADTAVHSSSPTLVPLYPQSVSKRN